MVMNRIFGPSGSIFLCCYWIFVWAIVSCFVFLLEFWEANPSEASLQIIQWTWILLFYHVQFVHHFGVIKISRWNVNDKSFYWLIFRFNLYSRFLHRAFDFGFIFLRISLVSRRFVFLVIRSVIWQKSWFNGFFWFIFKELSKFSNLFL